MQLVVLQLNIISAHILGIGKQNTKYPNAMINNTNIVITGLQSWDISIGSNCRNLAVEFSKNNRVLFVNPPVDRISDILNPRYYIYYTRDNLAAVRYWKIQGSRVEPLHMAKADLVVANSAFLAERAAQYNANSFFVGQGCDISIYSEDNYTIPDDIKNISGPRIGYTGSLNSLRLNKEILLYIAQMRPQWNLILVGPEDLAFKKSELHQLTNVHFLGPKRENELPHYINQFDVALNPQLVNDITIGNYPRKADEYLAMGKPVVATKTMAMEYFKNFIALADSLNDWIPLIEKELSENTTDKVNQRKMFAKQHTWEKNTGVIYSHVLALNNS